MSCVLAFSVALASGAAVSVTRWNESPPNAVNLTLFHVNQANYSGITNMNTGDAAGDAFFDLKTPLSVASCANGSSSHHSGHHGQCSNPEEFASNLIITKVIVEVNSDFGGYGECNVCENSTVPMTDPPVPCEDGTYHCRCGDLFGKDEPCTPPVGKENISSVFGKFPIWPGMDKLEFYMRNLVDRVGGTWYSTFDIGECGNPAATSCEWRLVENVKKVNATCHSTSLRNTLVSKGSACFQGCNHPLNTTDSCYLACYYETLLGSDAGTKYPSTGGMINTEIVSMWTDAFDGCPAL